MEISVIPEEFNIEYVFFGIGGKNSIEFNGKLIFIHKGGWIDPIKKITMEIEAQEEDWVKFWNKMDEIKVWNWKKRYENEDDEMNIDGDIWKITIIKEDKNIKSSGWAMGPKRLNAFFDALHTLIKVDIRNSNLLSNIKDESNFKNEY